jgi:ribosomal protein L40E
MAQAKRSVKVIICEYCATSNPWDANTCLACGGPLTRPKVDLEPQVTTVQTDEKPKQPQSEDVKKAAEKADELYFMAWNTYAIAWRTIGEAIAIALTGFILGFVGGATGVIFPGILGAILVGLAVGFTRKQFYLVLISAPAGLLLGLGIGAAIWFLGGGPQVMVYTGLVFAIIGAALGGRRSLPFRHRNCWEKARPLLGAMGGFAFGILGTLLGWGISTGIQSLLAL